MARPPEVHIFFETEGRGHLEQFFKEVRVADFYHVKEFLKCRLSRFCAARECDPTDKNYLWGRDCNKHQLELLRVLENEGIILPKELDGGAFGDDRRLMKYVYGGNYFDSGLNKLTRAFDEDFLVEFDWLPRVRRVLYFAKGSSACIRFHKSEGSEVISAQLGLASVRVAAELSSLPLSQSIAATWRLTAFPRTMKSYFENYSGDVRCEIDGKPALLCTPYVLRQWGGADRVQEFFKRLESKLDGQRYLICTPLAFGLCKDLPWNPPTANRFLS